MCRGMGRHSLSPKAGPFGVEQFGVLGSIGEAIAMLIERLQGEYEGSYMLG